VELPEIVPDANPPIPFVTSHSRPSAVSRFPQTSRPNFIRASSGISEVVAVPAFFRGARAFFAAAFLDAGFTVVDEPSSAFGASALVFPLSVRFEAIAFQSIRRKSSRKSTSRFALFGSS
jgi:hypothetical protein